MGKSLAEYLVENKIIDSSDKSEVKGFNGCIKGYPPLHRLVLKYVDNKISIEDFKTIFETLVEHGANVNQLNEENETVLSLILKYESDKIEAVMNYLLQKGVNPKNNEIFVKAVDEDNAPISVLTYLLPYYKQTAKNWEQLQNIVIELLDKQEEKVKFLIENQLVDLFVPNEDGNCLIHAIFAIKKLTSIEDMLKNSTVNNFDDIRNPTDSNGNTVLHFGMCQG